MVRTDRMSEGDGEDDDGEDDEDGDEYDGEDEDEDGDDEGDTWRLIKVNRVMDYDEDDDEEEWWGLRLKWEWWLKRQVNRYHNENGKDEF